MSDNSSILVPYLFNNRSVRVFTYRNEVWFAARDVGKALGMSNIRELIRNVLDVSECVYVNKVYDKELRAWTALVRNPDKLKEHCTNLVAINESGLYTIIMRSSKPEALKFRQWVTGEVLPSLRKTGRYEMSGERCKPEVKEETPSLYSDDICARLTLKNGIAIDIPSNADGYRFLSQIFKSLAMI